MSINKRHKICFKVNLFDNTLASELGAKYYHLLPWTPLLVTQGRSFSRIATHVFCSIR